MIPTFDLGNVIRRLVAVSTRVWANPITRFTSIAVLVGALVTTFNRDILSAFDAPSWMVQPTFDFDVSTRSDLFQTLGYLINFSLLADMLDFFFTFVFKAISFAISFISTLVSIKVIRISYRFVCWFCSTLT